LMASTSFLRSAAEGSNFKKRRTERASIERCGSARARLLGGWGGTLRETSFEHFGK
jgi:hypothetical protein